jgi:hypothetical protein
MTTKVIKVYGNMEWFRVAEQPESFDVLPDEFNEMKSLWESDSEANLNKILGKLTPYIGARFVADNLEGWKDYFDEKTYGEFEAVKIHVSGIDFSEEPIPSCKAEAWFEIALKEGILKQDVEKWIEAEHGGELYSAIVFYWNFDEYDGVDIEDLDLTFGDHNGAIGIICD